MERNRILVCTEDVLYGKRLLNFLAGKANMNVEFGLLTSLEKWEEIEERKNVIGILLEDSEYKKKINSCDFYGKIILLKTSKEQESQSAIFKYQSAESIYQEILMKFQVSDVCPQLSNKQEKKEVFCIFSLDGGNDGVLYSLKEGVNYAKRVKTILISLTALPVILSENIFEESLAANCLSELFLGIEDEGFVEKVRELVFDIYGMDVLPPIHCYKDLLDIKADDFMHLITRLQEECGYEVCIILCSEFYEFTFDLLSFVDKIMIPMKKDFMNQIRWNVLKRYLHMESKERLMEKIAWIECEQPLEITKEGVISWITDEEEGVIFNEYE